MADFSAFSIFDETYLLLLSDDNAESRMLQESTSGRSTPDLSHGTQMVVCMTMYGLFFFTLIHTLLCGRAFSGSPPSQEQEELNRRDYITSHLVVKHVIRKPGVAGSTSDKKKDEASTPSLAHRGKQILEQMTSDRSNHFNPNKTKSSNSETQDSSSPPPPPPSSSVKPTFQHFKSNLYIEEDEDEQDGTNLEYIKDSRVSPWLCAICLNEYKDQDEICWSQNPCCTHVYHHACIEAWLLHHNECPCCRGNFLPHNNEDATTTRTEEEERTAADAPTSDIAVFTVEHPTEPRSSPNATTTITPTIVNMPSQIIMTIPLGVEMSHDVDGSCSNQVQDEEEIEFDVVEEEV